jgi:hypothetical protein
MEINIFPRWLLAKLGLSPEKQMHAALLLSSVLAFAAAPLLIRIPHVCLMQTVLGLPCPGCGVLHSMTALRELDFSNAWKANPAGIAVAAVFLLQALARPVAIASARTAMPVTRISRAGSYAVLGSLFFVWIIRLATGGFHGCHLLSKM